MPLHNVYVCKIFDVWGVDFMGPFSPYFDSTYIFMLVDYVSKWLKLWLLELIMLKLW